MTRPTFRHLFSVALLAVVLAAFVLTGEMAGASTEPPPRVPPGEAQRTASGLVTLRLQEGYGTAQPDSNDYVAIHFVLWTEDGKKVQDSYSQEEPGAFLLEKVAPGWSEGVQLMVPGEKRRLWIPEELGPKKKKGQSLGAVICDVELVGFRRVTNLSGGEVTPPDTAERTVSGAYTHVSAKGQGTEKASTGVGALVHFTVWTQNARVHDTTVLRNRPTFFLYDRVMPAFADVLKMMVVGEKRRIWIPANVANGNWIGGPKGMLIFDVELLQIMDESVLAPPPSDGAQSSG